MNGLPENEQTKTPWKTLGKPSFKKGRIYRRIFQAKKYPSGNRKASGSRGEALFLKMVCTVERYC